MQKYFDKFDQAGNRPNGTINAGDIYNVAQRDGNVREVSANNDNLRNTFIDFPPFIAGIPAITHGSRENGQLPPQAVTLAIPEGGQAVTERFPEGGQNITAALNEGGHNPYV